MKSKFAPFLAGVVLTALLGGLVVLHPGCPKPNPNPAPPTDVDPNPQPPPTPPSRVPAGVVVVEDPATAEQTRGLFLANKRVQAFFKATNIAHAVYSVNATGPDGKPVGGRAGELIAEAKAAGVLPFQFVLDAVGGVISKGKLDLDPDKFVDQFDPHKDAPRAMGCKNESPKLSWPEFGTGAAPQTKLIPREQWQPIDLEAYAGPVHDQNGRGQCNASMGCNLLEMGREIGGMEYVYLSAGDEYSGINGGRDNGSTLDDGMARLRDVGVAPVSMVPYIWNGRPPSRDPKVVAERAKYRVKDIFLCNSFDGVASALQQGFPTGIGIKWYDNFRIDKDGWLPYQGRGDYGGHAIAAVGLAKRTVNGKDVWAVKIRNSWGPAWGMGGNCYVPETLFDGWIGGFWAVGSVVRTPDSFPKSEVSRRVNLSHALLESFAPDVAP